jgi:hypothetical protein
MALETWEQMKEGLVNANLLKKPTISHVPAGSWGAWQTRDARLYGFFGLPEYIVPFALEPRMLTRHDTSPNARNAYELGFGYIFLDYMIMQAIDPSFLQIYIGLEPQHIKSMSCRRA